MTRFGRPAYEAGRKNPVAKPAAAARTMIASGLSANGSAAKTPTSRDRRRPLSGGAIAGRSAARTAGRWPRRAGSPQRARTHPLRGVRPVVDVDRERDDGDPRSEPGRERRTEERPEARVSAQQAGLSLSRGARHVPGPYRGAPPPTTAERAPSRTAGPLESPPNAHRPGRAEAVQRPDDNAFAEQAVHELGGAVARVDVEEVRHGGAGGYEAVARARRAAPSSPLHSPAPPLDLGVVPRLASAASWLSVVTSNARRTLPSSRTIPSGPIP